MFEKILLAGFMTVTATSIHAADVVTRAEATELQLSHGKVVPRVERDTDGNVTKLRLNNMQLSKADVEQLGRLRHLRNLVVYSTKFSDQDLAQLAQCQHLEHLNLTNTEVTDDAIETILKLKKLRTVCLGNVNITPNAIEKLKALNRTRERTRDYLRWGYSQRKKSAE